MKQIRLLPGVPSDRFFLPYDTTQEFVFFMPANTMATCELSGATGPNNQLDAQFGSIGREACFEEGSGDLTCSNLTPGPIDQTLFLVAGNEDLIVPEVGATLTC